MPLHEDSYHAVLSFSVASTDFEPEGWTWKVTHDKGKSEVGTTLGRKYGKLFLMGQFQDPLEIALGKEEAFCSRGIRKPLRTMLNEHCIRRLKWPIYLLATILLQ